MTPATADERERALYAWATALLQRHHVDPAAAATADWTPVSGDASFRRFFRLRRGTAASWIAMDAPPQTENNGQFVALSRLFRDHGIDVPDVIARDLEHGFFLVTDLGDRLLGSVYDSEAQDAAVDAALRTLVDLQRIGNAEGLLPPYTAGRLRDELDLFVTWLVEGLLDLVVTPQQRQMLASVWTLLIDNAVQQPQLCVHRDYHSRNLLVGDDGRIGVVDFQDALWGPLCYDLVSLLRDCYHRFSEPEIQRWRDRYLQLARAAGVPGVPVDPGSSGDGGTHGDDGFARQFDRTGVQRHLKAAGIFARLYLRDGKDRYLPVIPGLLDHLIDVAVRDGALRDLGDWLAGHIRPAARARIIALAGSDALLALDPRTRPARRP